MFHSILLQIFFVIYLFFFFFFLLINFTLYTCVMWLSFSFITFIFDYQFLNWQFHFCCQLLLLQFGLCAVRLTLSNFARKTFLLPYLNFHFWSCLYNILYIFFLINVHMYVCMVYVCIWVKGNMGCYLTNHHKQQIRIFFSGLSHFVILQFFFFFLDSLIQIHK